jgi:peptidoglycan hydrolase-like protein with peptidoglycan-binding domain
MGESLGLGDVGFIVAVIQYMLSELSVLYDEIDNVEITGTFDTNTEVAITEFQKRNLFPQTGRVDKRTWDRLVKAFELATSSQN